MLQILDNLFFIIGMVSAPYIGFLEVPDPPYLIVNWHFNLPLGFWNCPFVKCKSFLEPSNKTLCETPPMMYPFNLEPLDIY